MAKSVSKAAEKKVSAKKTAQAKKKVQEKTAVEVKKTVKAKKTPTPTIVKFNPLARRKGELFLVVRMQED